MKKQAKINMTFNKALPKNASEAVLQLALAMSVSIAPKETMCAEFDSFVESVFEPFPIEAVGLQPSQLVVRAVPESFASSEAEEDECATEIVTKKKIVDGQVRYIAKW